MTRLCIVLVAALLAGCSPIAPESTPTTAPTASPTAAPTATPTTAPTASPTNTTTPTASAPPPTPMPAPTPIALSEYLDGLLADVAAGGGEWPSVAASDITATISNVLASHPELQDALIGQSGRTYPAFFADEWDICQHGDPELGGDQEENKVIGCGFVTYGLYNTYAITGDQRFLGALGDVLAWTQHHLRDADEVLAGLR
ncbi:MAG TPA: hypothetical protein VM284_04505 [Candidatus Limnocylindria bacterium]|nr:hypothetical protein [Candidatus Limnocylindria bacterium]